MLEVFGSSNVEVDNSYLFSSIYGIFVAPVKTANILLKD